MCSLSSIGRFPKHNVRHWLLGPLLCPRDMKAIGRHATYGIVQVLYKYELSRFFVIVVKKE